jgi:hypothetical protein
MELEQDIDLTSPGDRAQDTTLCSRWGSSQLCAWHSSMSSLGLRLKEATYMAGTHPGQVYNEELK